MTNEQKIKFGLEKKKRLLNRKLKWLLKRKLKQLLNRKLKWLLNCFMNCFRVLNDSNHGVYTLFSLLFQLNNNPLIPFKMSSLLRFNIFIPFITYSPQLYIHVSYCSCILVLNFYILLFSFQYIGLHKTSIQYAIFPITPTPNFIILTFFESQSQLSLQFILIPIPSYIFYLLPTWSASNLFQLPNPHPNPNSSNPIIG